MNTIRTETFPASRTNSKLRRMAELTRRRMAPCLAVVLLVLALMPTVPRVAASSSARGAWSATGSMTTTRYSQTATLLHTGQVLVAGGSDQSTIFASAEVYNSRTGAWTATGSMTTARRYHTATLLPDGRVLVAGGFNLSSTSGLASAELYDPATGTWTATGSMMVPRNEHSATLLPDGQVLVAGGCAVQPCTSVLSSAELYNPRTGTWTATGSMTSARCCHTATLLPDGQVLVAGGINTSCLPSSCPAIASAELYDPSTGTWTPTASMHAARRSFGATLLPNGQVLVAGGNSDITGYLASAEVYRPRTGTWTRTGNMADARGWFTLTLLPNGRALAAGGQTTSGGDLASAEVYNPGSGLWRATGHMAAAREDHTATLLPGGRVLVAGGVSCSEACVLSSAELYTP